MQSSSHNVLECNFTIHFCYSHQSKFSCSDLRKVKVKKLCSLSVLPQFFTYIVFISVHVRMCTHTLTHTHIYNNKRRHTYLYPQVQGGVTSNIIIDYFHRFNQYWNLQRKPYIVQSRDRQLSSSAKNSATMNFLPPSKHSSHEQGCQPRNLDTEYCYATSYQTTGGPLLQLMFVHGRQ